MTITEASEAVFRRTQAEIIAAIEALEVAHGGATFRRDTWRREATDQGPIRGGGGLTCVLEGGAVFERAGVNFSSVQGVFGEEMADRLPGSGRAFTACGISLVLHPRNPYVPTVHMNHRRLSRGDTGWFGGGADLTPYYLDDAACRHFHRTLKAACDAHPDVADYAAFKAACDAYFHNGHRGEARGIGGTFFDHLMDAPEATLAFVETSCAAFLPAYIPIVEGAVDRPYGDRERDWQLLRRGRYVEFNLIHDRGTTFGLQTGGRTESILMSLPPEVSWRYDHQPDAGTPEAALVDVLRSPRTWA